MDASAYYGTTRGLRAVEAATVPGLVHLLSDSQRLARHLVDDLRHTRAQLDRVRSFYMFFTMFNV